MAKKYEFHLFFKYFTDMRDVKNWKDKGINLDGVWKSVILVNECISFKVICSIMSKIT